MPEIATAETPEQTSLLKKDPATLTRGEKVALDIYGLLRARNSVIWIVTREEARVERYIANAALEAGMRPHTWDVAQGTATMAGSVENIGQAPGSESDPVSTIQQIVLRSTSSRPSRDVWIMRDLPIWLSGGMAGAAPLRTLRNAARKLPTSGRNNSQAIIILTPSAEVPPELASVPVIEFPLPDRDEIAGILDDVVAGLSDATRENVTEKLRNGFRDAAIDAAIGLTGDEVTSCYARSLVSTGTIDPVTVANEKKKTIAKDGLVEWFDPMPDGLAAVGGLDALKTWLESRKAAWTPQARAYGLPAPKGCLIVGIAGCGKSLTAKCVPTAFACPLLRVDLGAMRGKYVGQSEGNIRRVLSLIAAIGKCVVWLDEVEKALAGASQGAADGGVSADALGTLLSWMQDRSGEAFIIATANDVSALPPELLRKGRFDEVWSVDLPTAPERLEILQAALRQHKRADLGLDVSSVANACESFTGSEIASLVPSALFAGFADGQREITASDLDTARKSVVPLAQTMPEKIAALRKWQSEGRARAATTPAATPTSGTARQLDM